MTKNIINIDELRRRSNAKKTESSKDPSTVSGGRNSSADHKKDLKKENVTDKNNKKKIIQYNDPKKSFINIEEKLQKNEAPEDDEFGDSANGMPRKRKNAGIIINPQNYIQTHLPNARPLTIQMLKKALEDHKKELKLIESMNDSQYAIFRHNLPVSGTEPVRLRSITILRSMIGLNLRLQSELTPKTIKY